MQINHIHFIINPVSGKGEDIRNLIEKTFEGSDTKLEISYTEKEKNATTIAKLISGSTDLIAVFGGDGTVTETSIALFQTKIPMAIIPGGTANVMAKELGIPSDPAAMLEALRTNQFFIQPVDMGTLNGLPFLLRVNSGIMADMVLNTDRETKNNLGQLAYGLSAMKAMLDNTEVKYHLVIDGNEYNESGVSITITNSGNAGFAGLQLHHGISVNDGKLDLILYKHADIASLLKIAGSTVFDIETDTIKHWQCENVQISMEAEQNIICDDAQKKLSFLDIKVHPASLNVVLPVAKGKKL